MKKFKKSSFERMMEQSVKEGIVYLPVSRDNTERFDISTYLECDTHRDDVSIDQEWDYPSGPFDFGDYIPLYLICFGNKRIEISSERTLEEIMNVLKNENIEVKSILRIQDLER